jgi:SAM-dependent methyltransferase
MLPRGMQKPYEIARLIAEPVLPCFNGKIRQDLRRLVRPDDTVLDVGGRRSPYTVGVPARITILDLPRKNELQKQLELGVDEQVLETIRRRRSNVERVILEDMTQTTLPSERFDGVVSVEVIEHVPDDEGFVRQLARVLRPGGWAYLTTPNGDYIKKPDGGDHVRHYKRDELRALLRRHFGEVRVTYGIATGKNRTYAMQAWPLWNPVRMAETIVGNMRNRRESIGVEERPTRTAHLFALARKSVS